MNEQPMSDLPPFMVKGWTAEIGSHTFTAPEIIEFATAYDPQPFHLDQKLAEASIFGGLCASGWHTAAIWMRKQRDHVKISIKERIDAGLPIPEFGPSPGFENLQWLAPVFAGDTITYFNSTVAIRPSKSKEGWFILTGKQSGVNQHGKMVLTFESTAFLKYPA